MSAGSIKIFSEGIDYEYLELATLQKWVLDTISIEDSVLGYLNIIFCDDQYLLQINQDYLSHDYYTDIITFQYSTEPIEGELFISIDRTRDNAADLGVEWSEELHRVIIHGVLHLLGYNDKSDAERATMRQKEDLFLRHRRLSSAI